MGKALKSIHLRNAEGLCFPTSFSFFEEIKILPHSPLTHQGEIKGSMDGSYQVGVSH